MTKENKQKWINFLTDLYLHPAEELEDSDEINELEEIVGDENWAYLRNEVLNTEEDIRLYIENNTSDVSKILDALKTIKNTTSDFFIVDDVYGNFESTTKGDLFDAISNYSIDKLDKIIQSITKKHAKAHNLALEDEFIHSLYDKLWNITGKITDRITYAYSNKIPNKFKTEINKLTKALSSSWKSTKERYESLNKKED